MGLKNPNYIVYSTVTVKAPKSFQDGATAEEFQAARDQGGRLLSQAIADLNSKFDFTFEVRHA